MSVSRLLPILCVLLLCSCGGSRTAADVSLPYKQLIANAKTAAAAGNYALAAANYRAAYDRKPRRPEPLFRAAELFVRVRDYRRAAEAFQFLEPDNDRWPLLGLQYGRALKQDGRYEEAERTLSTFLDRYNGADRPLVSEIVRNELAGIRLARQAPASETLTEIERPGRGVNTGADEFGPVAVAGDELYFSSTAGGQSRLYQSRLEARQWVKATVPPGFPVIAEGEFGTGAFGPDGRAFYFTICSGLTGEDATNRCEIFRGERTPAGKWTQPRRLSATVNQAGANNAFPTVSRDADGRTVLYFASDRPGGRGGMDLYRAVQPAAGRPEQFSAATALPATINTVGDEITPRFDAEEQTLYFASNGHPGLGGLDVFRTTLRAGVYAAVTNLGAPVNSAADDYGLSLTPEGSSGYLTSNRAFGEQKTTTTETDVFLVLFRSGRARLKANVYDNTTGTELGNVEVTLYERTGDGGEREVARQTSPSGQYTFELRPGAGYRVVVRHPDYQPAEYRVETTARGTGLYGQPTFLMRRGRNEDSGGIPAPRSEQPRPVAESAPEPARPAPVAYRLQLSAARSFDPNDAKYNGIRNLGQLRSEEVPGRNLRRITVGYFTDEAAAKRALREVKRAGFPDAFAVRYNNGARVGQVRL